jgi:hypothetical protein
MSGTNQLFDPLRIQPTDPGQVSLADAWSANTKLLTDYLARQQQAAQDQGLWTGGQVWEGGHPTAAGVVNAAGQTAQGVMMGTTAPGDVAPGFTAFHGSPHDFDAFDTSKIGTGEGAQAYGHGLYFAGNEGVARSYRDTLSGNSPDAVHDAQGLLRDSGGDFDKASSMNTDMWKDPNSAPAQQVQRILDHWRTNGTDSLPPTAGHMYEVNIGADPAHFLDWDKPLSEQSQHVQDAVAQIGIKPATYAVRPVDNGFVVDYEGKTSRVFPTQDAAQNAAAQTAKMQGKDPTGAEMYRHTGDPAAVAQALHQAGIPGIRYLDQGSRAAANLTITPPTQTVSGKWMVKGDDYNSQGQHFDTQAEAQKYLAEQNAKATRNHVVFDANTIDILRKYGIAGLIAGGGAAAATGTQPQQ